ncbi:sialidase domain-containing protein [Streptococcus bouchesdurhonensis]|uniref:sialidase domain-containing protein n=1 Tax=Streptococcus bouchesdurhonensis TaxID=2954240 RepID=UPI00253FC6DF|nr:sialidase domain-containing protein [Streptococcus bouchesdurhonensis]
MIEKDDLETNDSNGKRVDLSDELEKVKGLQNATVHVEFKCQLLMVLVFTISFLLPVQLK